MAVAVGVAMCAASASATVTAMVLPGLVQRLGHDPAFGSGPLATVVQDLLTVAVYFAAVELIVSRRAHDDHPSLREGPCTVHSATMIAVCLSSSSGSGCGANYAAARARVDGSGSVNDEQGTEDPSRWKLGLRAGTPGLR